MKKAGMKVKAYKDVCQTVIVAKKGDVKLNYVFQHKQMKARMR